MERDWTMSAAHPEKQITWYEVPYPASAYTFPRESLIHDVRFDDAYIHIDLIDGHVLSVPLWWVPSVHNARMEERDQPAIAGW
jgi:hypothetical protein